MSLVTALGFVVLIPAAGFAGWKGALWWDKRTRRPIPEDPRDQEIRELSATLSITRKELAKASEERDGVKGCAGTLREKLERSNKALSNAKQNFNATKDHLSREIEQREDLLEESRIVRRELDSAQTQISELEVQLRMSTPSSEMIAGMDIVDDADAEQRIAGLEAEVERWKQHYHIVSDANKTLRLQTGSLLEESKLAAKSPILVRK